MSLYTTLENSSHDIRLIVLHPSEDLGAIIKCSLIQATLGAGREFEALSYAWGEGHVQGRIYINDLEIPVGEKLFVAMQHLRLSDRDRTLWVDALCINQKDTHERNHQVQQMSQIYASSWRVLIWLGPESDDSTLAINFIDGDHKRADWSRWSSDSQTPLISSGFEQEFVAIRRLCQRPYWERLWIVQEVLVAKQARIQAGFAFTTWERFDLFALHFANHRSFRESSDTFGGLANSLAVKLIPRQVKHQLQDSSLRELLVDFGASQCKDARDKIYGLAGLANDAESLEIDYHKTAYQIFVDVIVLQAYKDCATLVAFGQVLQRLLLNEVMDSVPSDACLSPYLIGSLGYDTGRIEQIGPFYADKISVPLHKRYRGGMDALLSEANQNGKQIIDELLLLRTQRLIHQQAIPILTQASYGLRGGQNFRRYQLLLLDKIEGGNGTKSPEPWGHLRRPAIPISEPGSRQTIPGYLRLDNSEFAHSKARFCVDDHGYIGVVPSNARKGDTLCWFRDCDIVAILRWSEDRYFFIGRAVFTQARWNDLPFEDLGEDASPISLYMTADALRLLTQ